MGGNSSRERGLDQISIATERLTLVVLPDVWLLVEDIKSADSHPPSAPAAQDRTYGVWAKRRARSGQRPSADVGAGDDGVVDERLGTRTLTGVALCDLGRGPPPDAAT